MSSTELTAFASFVIGIFGKKGPKILDTAMASHNHLLREKLDTLEYTSLVKEDEITIGRKDKPINKSDMNKFLKAFKARQDLEVFKNHHIYRFKGIVMLEDKTYRVLWEDESLDSDESPEAATVHFISGEKIKSMPKYKHRKNKSLNVIEIQDAEKVYPGIKELAKRGDVFVDIDRAGFQSEHMLFYDGTKDIIYHKSIIEEDGHPPGEYKLINEFPPGYWDVDKMHINDTFETPAKNKRGQNIRNLLFCWCFPSPPSYLHFDDLDIDREIETSKISFSYSYTFEDGETEDRKFDFEYFILKYKGRGYLIDSNVLNQAKELHTRCINAPEDYGYWVICTANHKVEKDKMLLNILREKIGDSSIDYVLEAYQKRE